MHTHQLLGLRPADLAAGRSHAERREVEPRALDALASALQRATLAPLARVLGLPQAQAQRLVYRVEGLAAATAQLADAGLRQRAQALRPRLRQQGFQVALVAEAFALVREAATRVLGQRHYPNQLAAGWWLLQGTLVEMDTGEGKTFAATLPAATAALAGLPVHVVTANDYLAERDARAMAPLYQFFGLRAGAALMRDAPAQRRAVYAGEVAYASAQGLAFDYLRERASLGERDGTLQQALDGALNGASSGATTADARLLRGLVYAIVDEADSVFVDEARTPLVLSARLPMTPDQLAQQSQAAHSLLSLAAHLVPGEHCRLDAAQRRAQLSDAGAALLAARRDDLPGTTLREAEQALEQALAALHLYHRDLHYVVSSGAVQIVDESTGRAMPDRSWERGLHALIEAKEGLALTAPTHTVARLTTQRLFRRYLRLAGMSGTLAEVAREVGSSLGLNVVRAPPHRPPRRRLATPRCLPDAAAKWAAVADEVARVAGGVGVAGGAGSLGIADGGGMADRPGRPVLVGTRTVAASLAVSAQLWARGIPHVVLNARQDADEAAIVARAGGAGCVTVATDMAGRGTDILLGPGVAALGGLHVVLSEYAGSRRIDRQLIGRAGRQGDPGSAVAIVAADDALFALHAPLLGALLRPWLLRPLTARAALACLRWAAQRHAEALHRAARHHTALQDRQHTRLLAYSGRGE